MTTNSSGLARADYPRCPLCGGPVAVAMMTSASVDLGFGNAPRLVYYHPDAISLYCVSASCNWDKKAATLTTPVPASLLDAAEGKAPEGGGDNA